MTSDAQISPEAQEFMANFPSDERRANFDKIDKLREMTREFYSPASERAIERHQLELSEIELGGIVCDRIVSKAGGTAGGHLFYIFGGAFIVGDPFSDFPIIGALAEHCGVEVIAPRYRLAPESPAPAAAQDCLAAYEVLAAQPDVDRLFMAGESAGGNLSLVTAQSAVAQGVRLPSAMGLLSPAVDMRTDPELYQPTNGIDPTLPPSRMDDVMDVYVADTEPTHPSVSPLFGSMDSLPPTIITTGTRDQLLAGCLRLERKMRRSGVEVDCRVWDGMWHVFEFYDDYPESNESLLEIAAFLNRH